MRSLVNGFLISAGLMILGLIKVQTPLGLTLVLVAGVFSFLLFCAILVKGLTGGFGDFRGSKTLKWVAWAVVAVIVLGWIL
jgi:hypothetical protein